MWQAWDLWGPPAQGAVHTWDREPEAEGIKHMAQACWGSGFTHPAHLPVVARAGGPAGERLVSGGLQGAPVVRVSGFSSLFSNPAALSVLVVVFSV